MKNAKELLSEATSKGYIMLPKHLMEIFLLHKKSQATELEAFLILLSRTNYKDETFRVKEKTMLCHRGESMRSLESWGQLFGWKKGKTTYFFNKLKRMGLIESIPNEVTTHLRIKEYEVWTGNEWRKPVPNEEEDLEFNRFWITFHEITHTNKVNIGRARREWKKLLATEKQLAISQIEIYYASLKNTNYCKQAATYLADKAYKNEYID